MEFTGNFQQPAGLFDPPLWRPRVGQFVAGIQTHLPLYTVNILVGNGSLGPAVTDRCRLGTCHLLVIACNRPGEPGAFEGQIKMHLENRRPVIFVNRPDICQQVGVELSVEFHIEQYLAKRSARILARLDLVGEKTMKKESCLVHAEIMLRYNRPCEV